MAALAQDDAAPLDVLLLDLGLPDGSGLDVLAALRARWPQAAAMVSTIFGDEVHVLDAIAAGAMGYLLKDLPATAVVDEVRSLHAGGSPINPMVARGHTLDEVARAMGVSRHTVRTFVRRVYAKLQVTTQAEAVSAAARQGWIHAAD